MSSTTSVPTASTSSVPAATTSVRPVGVLQGMDPFVYSSTDPLILFCVQAVIIISICRLLHYPLSKIRQPRVIAEVIGGIILGPTVMGRIPHFTSTIFPDAAVPNLTLVANLGLVFFLFLVGLEVDLRVMFRNSRVAISVSLIGMILPFGLGCAIAVGMYNEFVVGQPNAPTFGVFLLFIGVSFSITAFPVLARILTELKLLQTAVGVIVLSAGVGNDVVGWILLALTVALVNASSGVTVVYVLLCSVGWVLFLTYIVRPVFIFFANKNNDLHRGPSEMNMAVILLMVLISAFFTDIIGVHPIFGGFLVGLIVPHQDGYAIRVAEKIEDFVSTLLLPLYFALSGLRTNIGLLDNGITWGYTIGVIIIALVAKIAGSSLVARFNGLLWRESAAIGVLMSCKGLVELIALNVGLQAGILSQRVFTIFVVMALVTTFLTTPLVSFLYPPSFQKKVERWRRGEIDWDGNSLPQSPDEGRETSDLDEKESFTKPLISRCMVVLSRVEDLPTMMMVTQLVSTARQQISPSAEPHVNHRQSHQLRVHCLRLLELSQRTSAVMSVSQRHFDRRDPVISVFHTFGLLNDVQVTSELSIVPDHQLVDTLFAQARTSRPDFLIIPWSKTLATVESSKQGLASAVPQDEFIETVLAKAETNIAVMVDTQMYINEEDPSEPSLSRSLSLSSLRVRQSRNVSQTEIEVISGDHVIEGGYHIFMPFFGGADDRIALRLALLLLSRPDVTATVVRIMHGNTIDKISSSFMPSPSPALLRDEDRSSQGVVATSFGADKLTHGLDPPLSTNSPLQFISANLKAKQPTTTVTHEVESSPANILEDEMTINMLIDSLLPQVKGRLKFESVSVTAPLRYAVKRAKKEIDSRTTFHNMVVVGRGKRNVRHESLEKMLRKGIRDMTKTGQSDTLGKSCLGDGGEAMLLGKVSATVVVVQSGQQEYQEG